MTISKKVEAEVNKVPIGTTFTYQSLAVNFNEYAAAAKAIERLIKKDVIKRVSTGVFYKPKKTIFGELMPREDELLKNYLFEKNKRIAYVTGLSLYNKLGLTTQVPTTIKIASRDKRIFATLGNLKGKPVKSYIDVSDKNYYVLEILDALKDFKQIPDMDKKSGVLLLTDKIKKSKGNLNLKIATDQIKKHNQILFDYFLLQQAHHLVCQMLYHLGSSHLLLLQQRQ
jgi:hypothetical protein